MLFSDYLKSRDSSHMLAESELLNAALLILGSGLVKGAAIAAGSAVAIANARGMAEKVADFFNKKNVDSLKAIEYGKAIVSTKERQDAFVKKIQTYSWGKRDSREETNKLLNAVKQHLQNITSNYSNPKKTDKSYEAIGKLYVLITKAKSEK